VQYITEKELARQVTENRARGGVAIVMDPHSGEVLALAHQPSFNPNSFLDYRPTRWKRSAVANTYEPGSTFKVVTLAALLEEGLARPEEMIFAENGTLMLAGRAYHDVHSYRWLTVREVISKSSNIGTIKLGQRLGKQLLHHYIRKFGFGSRTGIDLPGEATGLVRGTKLWSRVSIGSVSIGYEVSVTPIQMVAAYAALANGGLLVQPRVVRKVIKAGEPAEELPSRPPKRVISSRTARVVTSILQEAVETGTGRAAAVEGYSVAGKTGTAQKFDPRLGVYSSNKYIASFVGYLPAEDPRVVILVLIDEPQGAFYGGVVAAPVFSRIAAQVVRYLKTPAPGNLLRVAALNRGGEETTTKNRGGLRGVFSRINKGFRHLIGRAKSSFMSPMGRKMADQNTRGRTEKIL
jgi:cell division protein FtsI (penicillin-binding protein 3)